MFNADCHVGVVYLIMCKPTTLLHATLYVLFFCLYTIGLRVHNLLITYNDDDDDDDDDDETEKPTSPTLKTCEWVQY